MAYVNKANDAIAVGSTSAAAVATYPSTPTQGDLMLATVLNSTNTTVASTQVSDPTTGNWTLLASYNLTVTGQCIAVYGQIAGASQSKTISTANASAKNYLQIHEYSGNFPTISQIIDNAQAKAGGAASGVKTSNGNGAQTVTTTNATDLVIVFAANNATTGSSPTWTGATAGSQNPNTTAWLAVDAYQIETSTGSYTPYVTWTGTARGVEQITIALLPSGATVSVSIAQVSKNLVLTTGTQVVAATQVVSISQVSANLVLNTGTQVVAAQIDASIAQVSANLVLSGGTQTITAANNINITQDGTTPNLKLTGGTQVVSTGVTASIAQVGANLVLNDGTQGIATVNNVNISQSAANLVLSGGTQVIATQIDISIAQSAANLIFTGGTQSVSANSPVSTAVTQVSVNLVLSPGIQTLGIPTVPVITTTPDVDIVVRHHKTKHWLKRDLTRAPGIYSNNPLPKRILDKIYPDSKW